MPSSACWPPAASGPVFTVSRPIFIGAFCAIAGIANVAAPAAAAVPLKNLRRLRLSDIVSSPRFYFGDLALNSAARATGGALCCPRLPNSELMALEPGRALGIKRVQIGPVEAGHVAFDHVADLGLQISEVAVAFRKLRQQILVEHRPRRGVDRIDAVFFVSQAAEYDAPFAFALFQKIIEPSGAHHVTDHALDRRALRDGHFGLRDGALALDVDAHAAEHVHDAHAAVVAFLADLDEFLESALKPGRPHMAVAMPDRAETVPHARIAPQRPVLDQRADGQAVGGVTRHNRSLSWPGLSRPSTSLLSDHARRGCPQQVWA